MAHKRRDILWKGVVDEFIIDMLRFFFTDADEFFDFSQPIEFLDPELAQLFPDRENMKDSNILDRLVKVGRLNGSIARVYLLLEFHDYHKKHINYNKRIFKCFSRLYDKYDDGVMALVVYTGSDKSFRPGLFEYVQGNINLSFAFGGYRVIDQQQEELKKSTNLFAIFIRTVLLSMKKGKVGNDVLIDMHVELAKEVALLGLAQDKLNELLQFISLYIDFGKTEINRTLDKRISEVTVKTDSMNLYEAALIIRTEDAIEETAEKKNMAFVKKLLLNDKHSFTLQEIAEMIEVPIDFVLDVKAQLEST